MDLHHDLVHNKIATVDDIQRKYKPSLDTTKYYASYFANRIEYKQVIDGPTQRLSHLDVMPFLFEMKTLVKIGNLLDYINTYYSRLLYDTKWSRLSEDESEYYFDIHYNNTQRGQKQENKSDNKLFNKQYRVFSEKQLENGDCAFAVERCTPDIDSTVYRASFMQNLMPKYQYITSIAFDIHE
eukprot:314889_1